MESREEHNNGLLEGGHLLQFGDEQADWRSVDFRVFSTDTFRRGQFLNRRTYHSLVRVPSDVDGGLVFLLNLVIVGLLGGLFFCLGGHTEGGVRGGGPLHAEGLGRAKSLGSMGG